MNFSTTTKNQQGEEMTGVCVDMFCGAGGESTSLMQACGELGAIQERCWAYEMGKKVFEQ